MLGRPGRLLGRGKSTGLFGAGTPAGVLLGSETSGLAIDFAQQSALVRGHTTEFSGLPSDLLAYTAPSPKMVYGSDGVLRYAPHNLMKYSLSFSGLWTLGGVTTAPATALAPDGTLTATPVVETSAGGGHYIQQADTSVGPNKLSVYAKPSARGWLRLIRGTSTVWFDLVNEAIGTQTLATGAIEDAGGGWKLCTLYFSGSSVGSSMYVAFEPANNSVSYQGVDGQVSGYIWKGSLQQTPVHVGSYPPTTTAARYSPPLDHDPVTLAPLGVLIEEQRTNLLLRSAEFDNASWANAVGTVNVSANAILAPDGTLTMDKLVPAAATASMLKRQIVTYTAAEYTFSVFAKEGDAGVHLEMFFSASSSNGGAIFNLSSGAVLAISNCTTGVVDVGGGIRRYYCTFTPPAGVSVCDIWVTESSTRSQAMTGNGVKGFYLWGAQLELGAFPTSYIPTTSAQVTRAADQITLATSALPYNNSAGTIVVKGVKVPTVNQSGAIVAFNTATYLNNFAILKMGADAVSPGNRFVGFLYGAGQTAISLAAFGNDGNPHNLALTFDSVNAAGSADGAAVVTGTSQVTAPSKLSLGYRDGMNGMSGHIKSVVYLPRRATNSELQAMTA